MSGLAAQAIDISARNIDLASEGFHLAVRMGPLVSSSSLVATRLLSVPMHLLASPRLLETLVPIKAPSDLPPALRLPLVQRPWAFGKGRRRDSLMPLGRFASNSGAALLQEAIDGLGIVNVPAYYADAVVVDGRLQRILPDWDSVEESTFYLVFPAGRHMPLRVRRLIDFLQAELNRTAH